MQMDLNTKQHTAEVSVWADRVVLGATRSTDPDQQRCLLLLSLVCFLAVIRTSDWQKMIIPRITRWRARRRGTTVICQGLFLVKSCGWKLAPAWLQKQHSSCSALLWSSRNLQKTTDNSDLLSWSTSSSVQTHMTYVVMGKSLATCGGAKEEKYQEISGDSGAPRLLWVIFCG